MKQLNQYIAIILGLFASTHLSAMEMDVPKYKNQLIIKSNVPNVVATVSLPQTDIYSTVNAVAVYKLKPDIPEFLDLKDGTYVLRFFKISIDPKTKKEQRGTLEEFWKYRGHIMKITNKPTPPFIDIDTSAQIEDKGPGSKKLTMKTLINNNSSFPILALQSTPFVSDYPTQYQWVVLKAKSTDSTTFIPMKAADLTLYLLESTPGTIFSIFKPFNTVSKTISFGKDTSAETIIVDQDKTGDLVIKK